jgi:hypothetical protein
MSQIAKFLTISLDKAYGSRMENALEFLTVQELYHIFPFSLSVADDDFSIKLFSNFYSSQEWVVKSFLAN